MSCSRRDSVWAVTAVGSVLLVAGCHYVLGFDEEVATGPGGGQGGSPAAGGDAPGGTGGVGATGTVGGSGGDGGGIGGGAPDTTPPTIVSVDPPHMATGVMDDAQIVIQFSEPMAPAATLAAFDGGDLPAVTLVWNASFDTLTIVPATPLAIAEYTHPNAVPAVSYTFTLAATATDVAGNPMLAQVASSFSTARRVLRVIPFVSSFTGYGGTTNVFFDNLAVGEGAGNTPIRGYAGFDVSPLAGCIEVEEAMLETYQYSVTAGTYALGDVSVDHFVIATLNAASYSAAPLAQLGVLSDDAVLEQKTLDVTTAVRNDLSALRTYSQFRLAFTIETNNDANQNTAFFQRDAATRLRVTYLIP